MRVLAPRRSARGFVAVLGVVEERKHTNFAGRAGRGRARRVPALECVDFQRILGAARAVAMMCRCEGRGAAVHACNLIGQT